MKKRFEQRLIFSSIAALLLLNFPFIVLFNKVQNIGGIPLILIWIFCIWLIIIFISYFTIKQKGE